LQIVSFHQFYELSNLIWFGPPVHVLQIDQFPNLRMREDVVTAIDT